MTYLSGLHALNLPCQLNTTGDWHRECCDWTKPDLQDSNKSVFGTYGIETNVYIPYLNLYGHKANHIRALLDLLSQNRLLDAQGMKEDYICCDAYTSEIFDLVLRLRTQSNWAQINSFMYKEYRSEWRVFLQSKNIPLITDANIRVNKM